MIGGGRKGATLLRGFHQHNMWLGNYTDDRVAATHVLCYGDHSPPLLCPVQVSGLQRERTKLAILQEAVIVASTLSFAGGARVFGGGGGGKRGIRGPA